MDFVNRGTQTNQSGSQHSAAPAPKSRRKNGLLGWLKVSSATLLVAAAILVLAVVAYLSLANNGTQENKYVDSKKLQAVFLNGGQVYFGNIGNLNGKFLTLNDIYYLRVNQQVQPKNSSANSNNNVSLVKLGCELHGPEDRMVINRDQVIFWENLKNNGQVAKAIATFKKSNPNGQNCQQTNSGTTTPTTNTSKSTTTPQ